MAKTVLDYSFNVENHPGALASLAELIAAEGINLDGCFGAASADKGVVHIHTNNPQATSQLLNGAGIKFETRELFELDVQDKPGELAKLARSLADAKVNITLFYITMKPSLVLGVDNVSAAKQVFQRLGL